MKRMDGFNDRLIDGYTEAIADVKNVRFSLKDQATISEEFAHVCKMQISKSSYLLLMKISSLIGIKRYSRRW